MHVAKRIERTLSQKKGLKVGIRAGGTCTACQGRADPLSTRPKTIKYKEESCSIFEQLRATQMEDATDGEADATVVTELGP